MQEHLLKFLLDYRLLAQRCPSWWLSDGSMVPCVDGVFHYARPAQRFALGRENVAELLEEGPESSLVRVTKFLCPSLIQVPPIRGSRVLIPPGFGPPSPSWTPVAPGPPRLIGGQGISNDHCSLPGTRVRTRTGTILPRLRAKIAELQLSLSLKLGRQ